MKSLGGLLFFLGLGSFVLNYLDYEFSVLSWVDNWGPNTGMSIRIGLIVIGAVMWLVGRKQAAAEPAQS